VKQFIGGVLATAAVAVAFYTLNTVPKLSVVGDLSSIHAAPGDYLELPDAGWFKVTEVDSIPTILAKIPKYRAIPLGLLDDPQAMELLFTTDNRLYVDDGVERDIQFIYPKPRRDDQLLLLFGGVGERRDWMTLHKSGWDRIEIREVDGG